MLEVYQIREISLFQS